MMKAAAITCFVLGAVSLIVAANIIDAKANAHPNEPLGIAIFGTLLVPLALLFAGSILWGKIKATKKL
jgi:hypothetical protein